jgi:phosphoribosylanthranilate isomerase
MNFHNLIQIAGVRNLAEAEMLLREGVACLGFPLRLAVHKEDLSETDAAALIRRLPRGVDRVLITYLDTAAAVAEFATFLGVNAVQLHGEITVAEFADLRRRRPDLALIKSLVVRPGNLPELKSDAERFAPWADAFITDTFDPATGACGATGRTHDWSVSRELVRCSLRPVILAGGLTPENVADAIAAVRPAGVDVHTGVEDAGGAKDPAFVRKFMTEARRGFAGGKPAVPS